MKLMKRVQDQYVWVPMHKRKDRFGQPLPPRKPDPRIAIFWMARDGDELYFVNNSDETLTTVVADTGGYLTTDDEAAAIGGGSGRCYADVMPGEAVLVDVYEPQIDCDFVLGADIQVRSPSRGDLTLIVPYRKGGATECVLLWDTGNEDS